MPSSTVDSTLATGCHRPHPVAGRHARRLRDVAARFAGMAALAAGMALSGCASLPSGFDKPASTSLAPAVLADSRLLRTVAASRPAPDASGFRLLPSGTDAFNTRVALARRAQHSLDVQYYLVHDDETGRALLRELQNAAARGVRVRLLIDDIATQTQDQTLLRLARQTNIEVRLFNPFAWGRSSLATRILSSLGDLKRVNHRMHNKSFIADNCMAITGGRNIGDEYFMHGSASNFIDLDVFAAGAIVGDLSDVFDRYWNSSYTYPVATLVRFDQALADKAAQMMAAGAPATMLDADGLVARDEPVAPGSPSLTQEIDAGRLRLEWAPARVVADDPSKVAGVSDTTVGTTASGMLMSLMQGAQSEVTVVSPYFVPGKPGMALMRALHARGVRMAVLTNSLAATDAPLVHIGYAHYRPEMLALGVHLYELSPTGGQRTGKARVFGSSRAKLHAKTAIIDRQSLFVGSINLDARSARENTEQGLIIQSPALAGEVLQMLTDDHGESAFRLQLGADHHSIEWVGTDNGVETIFHDEPDASLWLRFGLWLLAPVAPEQLL